MTSGSLYLLAAFTLDPTGGNPAGVWIGDSFPETEEMQRIAADVGFSETAFVTPRSGFDRNVRYFSPEAEVSFCGHATIATGVLLGETVGEGRYRLTTGVGVVSVDVRSKDGHMLASLTSVEPTQKAASDDLVAGALAALRWDVAELDKSIPPACAYAGAWHLVLAVATLSHLQELDYHFEELRKIMLRENLTTLQLVWRQSPNLFHSRNPFPVGGVIEDPATGAAAAALGGYLRASKLVQVPTQITIRQGEAMERPSELLVDIPAEGGIVVTGTAVRL